MPSRCSNVCKPGSVEILNKCHEAANSGRQFSLDEKRELFKKFFLWEQERVVGLAVDDALANFYCNIIKWLALKPRIRFSYFPSSRRLVFNNFSNMDERIEKGQAAFEMAASLGWNKVEECLKKYRIMSKEFHENAEKYYTALYDSCFKPA